MIWVAVVFGDSDADAGYRRTDPNWSRYTRRRNYNSNISPIKGSKLSNYAKRLTENNGFAKRISSAKKNPLSSQYLKPEQPLGLILNVGDQRKLYKKSHVKTISRKKGSALNDKKLKKILKKKGPRGKVKLVRRKNISRRKVSPQKTFRPKKGSTFQFPGERVFSDIYPSGTLGHALLNGEAGRKLFNKRPKKSQGSYRPPKPKRPYKKPSAYKPPKKQSYKPPKKPTPSYKPPLKPQHSYKPAPKPEPAYKPAKKPEPSYNPPEKKPEPAYKPEPEYTPVETSYDPPKETYEPAEPEYKPVETSYDPPKETYKPEEPEYKPEPDYKPSYEPDAPKEVYKPEPEYKPSYEPEEVSSYKPPQVDYKQPEYETEVTSYKPPASVYEPLQAFDDFPKFPMPDFSSFLMASFEPNFSFKLPKLNSKI